MTDFLPPELRRASTSGEKAAIIADFILNDFPASVAFVARRCVILHWFDVEIVKAMLHDISAREESGAEIYIILCSLPFIEELPWGLAFQDLTRDGLIA